MQTTVIIWKYIDIELYRVISARVAWQLLAASQQWRHVVLLVGTGNTANQSTVEPWLFEVITSHILQ